MEIEPSTVSQPVETIAPARAGERPPVSNLDHAAREFIAARPRLFRIARRILRNPFEAEDVVQDAWIRWQGADHEVVLNAQAFLTTTTTRLALNQAQCARRRRETPAGSWLREPSEPAAGPETDAERGEAVELAVLLMLANLTPNQRAAYLLRESFDYRYDRIAELLQLSEANCRQLVRRAKHRMASERRRPVSVVAHKRLLDAFLAAANHGHFADLEQLLVADADAAARQRPANRRGRNGVPLDSLASIEAVR